MWQRKEDTHAQSNYGKVNFAGFAAGDEIQSTGLLYILSKYNSENGSRN